MLQFMRSIVLGVSRASSAVPSGVAIPIPIDPATGGVLTTTAGGGGGGLLGAVNVTQWQSVPVATPGASGRAPVATFGEPPAKTDVWFASASPGGPGITSLFAPVVGFRFYLLGISITYRIPSAGSQILVESSLGAPLLEYELATQNVPIVDTFYHAPIYTAVGSGLRVNAQGFPAGAIARCNLRGFYDT